MYPVSEAFLTAVQENTRSFYWTGRITTKAGAVYAAEIEAMPNGSELLSVYTENDIETYRDVLFYVGQVQEIEEYMIPETDTCSKCGGRLEIIGKELSVRKWNSYRQN